MYDLVIVGSGISSLFFAYSLCKKNMNLKILVVEKGNNLPNRICPIENRETDKCNKCRVCNKLSGFGGMGKSEGKFNYTNGFGGDLKYKIGDKQVLELMKEVDKIICSLGGEKVKMYSTKNKELTEKYKDEKFQFLWADVRHLGTSMSNNILKKIYEELKDKVTFKFSTQINDISKEKDIFFIKCRDEVFTTKKIIFATGISGGKDFLKYLNKFNIEPSKFRVDLGLRVQLKKEDMKNILKKTFEIKIKYKDEEMEAVTYCMNPGGGMIKKHVNGMVMVDGENYLEKSLKNDTVNFSVFIPRYFNNLNHMDEYIKKTIKFINKDRERIAVQRLGDLLNNVETNEDILRKNTIEKLLPCEGSNLSNEVPKVYIQGMLKIIDIIEKVEKRKVDDDTLIYAIDAKFYEPYVKTDEDFETEEEGLYLIGDCSGVTYSLASAAASGVYLAHKMAKIKK